MRSTKENAINRIVLRGFITCILVPALLCFGASNKSIYQANAAVFSVHNYVTDDTYQYSGEPVRYEVDGVPVASSPPGIILSNGAAVGPFNEVFRDTLGVTCNYTEGKDSFTVSYGSHTIKMTLGNTEVSVNGVTCNMNNAPFVYSFDHSTEKHLYVPTRFLAETFGFDYNWNEATSTASIRRAYIIYDGDERLKYNGAFPKFLLNNSPVTSAIFPGYILDDTVLFSAEKYIKNPGIASFSYSEGSGLILLKNGDCIVRLVLNSPVAYIDDTAYVLPTVPRLITPPDSSKASVYVPAEFVLKALGFSVNYNADTEVLHVTGIVSGSNNITTGSGLTSELYPDTASYGSSLFTYKTHEQIIDHFTGLGQHIPKEISAYSCLNSDALYLKGVDSSDIIITDKDDVIEIFISGYQNPYNGKVNYDPDAAFLNYFYIRGTDAVKILIIKTKELHYYTYSAPDGCVVHFTDSNGMYEDYLKFVEGSDLSDSDSGTTDVFDGENLSSYLPEALFTRDHFVIRLPENISPASIKDEDEYDKKRFTISIPGNHMRFLSEQDTYKSLESLNSVQFSYKVANNTTVITFNTSKIQGYTFTVVDNLLGVHIADPREIYDKIIVLDAGHGGIDPGTLRGNVYEKTVNYNVINVYAKDYFKDSDIKVYYTRTTDTKIALQTRADFAASVGADLFVSFHVNAHSNAAVNGTGVYYSKSNNNVTESGLKSAILATEIGKRLSSAWGTKNNGILADKFIVIHNNSVPAVLVECGFITNNKDFEKIKDASYQKKAAKALFDAVSAIFNTYPTNR